MKATLAALAILVGSVSSGSLTPRQQSVSAFSITLEATPRGWAAHCDSGCRWRGLSLSFECAMACPAIVDANGLVTTLTPRSDATAFSFTVAHTTDGVRARSRVGTAWTTLSWGCQASPCRVQIDAMGVRVK
jgi:hypothetical protein